MLVGYFGPNLLKGGLASPDPSSFFANPGLKFHMDFGP